MNQQTIDFLNEKLESSYHDILIARDFYEEKNNNEHKLFKKITDLLYKLLKEINK